VFGIQSQTINPNFCFSSSGCCRRLSLKTKTKKILLTDKPPSHSIGRDLHNVNVTLSTSEFKVEFASIKRRRQ
jgi:hypothetical protein